jgi:peptidase YpeB-like protein
MHSPVASEHIPVASEHIKNLAGSLAFALSLVVLQPIGAQERHIPESPGIAPVIPRDPVQDGPRKALVDEARISMIEAVTAARKVIPGKAVKVTMRKEQGRVFYNVETLDANKISHSVDVDARDGTVR